MTDKTPKRRGCLFYGLLAGGGLLFVLVGVGLAVFLYARSLTDPRPMALPPVQFSDQDTDLLQDRIRGFQQAVRQHNPTPPLTLTDHEINALMAANPDLKPLHEKLRVTIEGDQLKGLVSIPVKDLGLPVLRDRFLNGSATFKVAFANNLLQVTPETILVKGKPLPGFLLNRLRERNLAQRINQHPRASLALERLQSVEVRDSKLVIAAKAE